MDKTTKGFIIAACSVIIATPVAWLGLQVFQQVQINAARQAAEKAEAAAIAEKKRRDDRDNPCWDRAKADWPLPVLNYDDWLRKPKWVGRCKKSTLPVDQVEFPPR